MKPPLLCVLSGLALAASFPPFPSSPLPFVALVPFAVFVAERPQGRKGSLEAAEGGLWLGGVFFTALLYWIAFSLPGGVWVGALALLAVVAVLSLAAALCGWILHQGVNAARAPLWLALPIAWTCSEWARSHLPGGLAFPWGSLSLTLTGVPGLLGLSEWTGDAGVSLWIGLANGLLASAIVGRRRGPGSAEAGPKPARGWVALAAAGVAVPLLMAARPNGGLPAGGETLTVALLQTATTSEQRRDPQASAAATALLLERLLGEERPGGLDILVLPEMAFPVALETNSGRPYLEGLQRLAERLQAPVLTGALGSDEAEGPARSGSAYNSALLVDGSGVRGRYDKRRLVPGVERVPVLPTAWLPPSGRSAYYHSGVRRPLITAGRVPIAVLVCFESAFFSIARDQRRRGAQILVNLTNDEWFGGGLAGRAARAQHEAHLVLRAVEGRVTVLRAANGGRSMVVEPSGRVRLPAPDREEALTVVEVFPTSTLTLVERTGDVAGPLSAIASLLLIWMALRGRSRPLATADS